MYTHCQHCGQMLLADYYFELKGEGYICKPCFANTVSKQVYTEYNGIVYRSSHGSPFDRGIMDSYYRRGASPHRRIKNIDKNKPLYTIIEEKDLSNAEIESYHAGYDYNQYVLRDFKEWE